MSLDIPDAPTFFRLSCGSWRSQRSVHHLLHRRAEAGGSLIVVEDLETDDPRLLEMARQHDQDPGRIIGGSYVRWSASMAWDRDGDAHDGETCFALSATARLHDREPCSGIRATRKKPLPHPRSAWTTGMA